MAQKNNQAIEMHLTKLSQSDGCIITIGWLQKCLHTSPVTTGGGFGGLSPPKQSFISLHIEV